MRKLGKVKKFILISMVFFTGFFVFIFVATSLSIGRSVKEKCYFAQKDYGKNCVESLITLVEDEERSFEDRNHAIWALGQLGNERALIVLKKYYTGNIPEKEPYNKGISQYELKKAITLLESGLNLTAFIWR